MYPVLFHIYGFEFYTYPFVLFLGILFASYIFFKICLNKKLSLDFFTDYLWFFIVSFFVFSRIGGVLEVSHNYIIDPLKFLYITDGVYNFYAGFFGFILTFFYITYLKKENIWKWFDAFIIPFLYFIIFLFLADFLSGQNYGVPSNLPWAVVFNIPEVRYTIPVHPVQIYKIISIVFLLCFLFFYKRKKIYDGALSSYGLFGFFLIQSVFSLLYGNLETLIFNFRISFLISTLASFIFLVILVYRTHPDMHFFHIE